LFDVEPFLRGELSFGKAPAVDIVCKEKEFYLSERRFGSFQRSFQVPDDINADKIAATFKNGVLTVILPKSPEAQKKEKKIAIRKA
jgi:HSP20 family protein